ncbi:MAG: hypothetical protein HQL31_01765 [Planctomycetes bacterium]|nr:hypothetical protein [Planctomycetota bacterium]
MKKFFDTRTLAITLAFVVAALFLLAGDLRNDVLEIHTNGASMCLSCIGLE